MRFITIVEVIRWTPGVDVVDKPIRRIQGRKPRNFKVFGGYSPGWFAYGSFFGGAVRLLLFATVNGRKPRGLEISLDGANYTRLTCIGR